MFEKITIHWKPFFAQFSINVTVKSVLNLQICCLKFWWFSSTEMNLSQFPLCLLSSSPLPFSSVSLLLATRTKWNPCSTPALAARSWPHLSGRSSSPALTTQSSPTPTSTLKPAGASRQTAPCQARVKRLPLRPASSHVDKGDKAKPLTSTLSLISMIF